MYKMRFTLFAYLIYTLSSFLIAGLNLDFIKYLDPLCMYKQARFLFFSVPNPLSSKGNVMTL